MKVRNKESNTLATHYYNGATQTHTFTMSIDLVDPYHCIGTAACVGSMLTVPDVIKTVSTWPQLYFIPDGNGLQREWFHDLFQSIVNLRWSGWSDADAGIDRFVRDVYELHAFWDVLRDKRRVDTTTLTSSTVRNCSFNT